MCGIAQGEAEIAGNDVGHAARISPLRGSAFQQCLSEWTIMTDDWVAANLPTNLEDAPPSVR
jgi:hypothetical protein